MRQSRLNSSVFVILCTYVIADIIATTYPFRTTNKSPVQLSPINMYCRNYNSYT